ncbi:rhodopsin-like [Haliotis asinina]|uniref:rhodopsin-like n=1 Tax=Haliotis asinina TaxID=109174 RepID=UPI0035321EEF
MVSTFDTTVSLFGFVVIGIAFISNVAQIIVMLKKKIVSKRPFEMCLFSMAFSDLMFVLTTGLPFAVYKWHGTWSLGAHICQVYVVGRAVFEKISLYTIGFIGIESFRSLGNVGGQAFSMATTRCTIVCVWVLTLATGCPYAVWHVLVESQDGSQMCQVTFFNPITAVYTIVMKALYIVPLLVIIICYSGVMYRTIKSRRRVVDISSIASTSAARRQHLKPLLRVTSSCIWIATLYMVCKIPFTVVLLRAYASLDTSELMLAEALWVLSTANAATSPFVYRMLTTSKLKCCRIKFWKKTSNVVDVVPVKALSVKLPDAAQRLTRRCAVDVFTDEAQHVTTITLNICTRQDEVLSTQ